MYHQQTPLEKDPRLWDIARRRAAFKRHLLVYLVMSVFFWVLWLLTGDGYHKGEIPWPVWPMFGWGIGIVFNYINAYNAVGNSGIEREYQKLKEQQSKNN